MKRYETRETTIISEVVVETTCDGCGIGEEYGAMGRLVPVVISINEGEEGGHVTELDYCDDCLVDRAPAFVAAGAKAPIVTGEELPFDDEEV